MAGNEWFGFIIRLRSNCLFKTDENVKVLSSGIVDSLKASVSLILGRRWHPKRILLFPAFKRRLSTKKQVLTLYLKEQTTPFEKVDTLPNTGDSNPLVFLSVGMLFISGALGLFFKKIGK